MFLSFTLILNFPRPISNAKLMPVDTPFVGQPFFSRTSKSAIAPLSLQWGCKASQRATDIFSVPTPMFILRRKVSWYWPTAYTLMGPFVRMPSFSRRYQLYFIGKSMPVRGSLMASTVISRRQRSRRHNIIVIIIVIVVSWLWQYICLGLGRFKGVLWEDAATVTSTTRRAGVRQLWLSGTIVARALIFLALLEI
jgi:hypothetical protein